MNTAVMESGPEPRAPQKIFRVDRPMAEPAQRWTVLVDELVDKVGGCEMPVLVQGETGVGKEVVARKLHARSPRRNGPFIKINCAALPADLIESELFGYEKGAFTGALKTNPGKFALAAGGCIFLDEIGDMDVRLQAKLLQVLQDSEYMPLGSRETVRVDVRVIAATHRDLRAAVETGGFREDLYYRLDVINIHIPPLRDRTEEILELAALFSRLHSRDAAPPAIGPELAAALLRYEWPGNIRELENLIKRLIVFKDETMIVNELLRRSSPGRAHCVEEALAERKILPFNHPPALHELKARRDAEEAAAILKVLEVAHWNRRRAAQMLNIEYKRLLYKMKKLGIESSTACAG